MGITLFLKHTEGVAERPARLASQREAGGEGSAREQTPGTPGSSRDELTNTIGAVLAERAMPDSIRGELAMRFPAYLLSAADRHPVKCIPLYSGRDKQAYHQEMCGEGEIRTRDAVSRILAFQASALGHYATSPRIPQYLLFPQCTAE